LVNAFNAQTDSVYYGNKEPDPKLKKERKKSEWMNDLNYGGNFQVYFGQITFVYLNPTIGYHPIDKLNVGVGGVYSYIGGRGVSTSMFGPQAYARYSVFPNFMLVGQFEKLNQPDWNSSDPEHRIWVDYALGGIGYTQKAGDKAMFYTTLLYNFTPHRSSIYPSNFILQFGFNTRF
jgi:hypothetical protein